MQQNAILPAAGALGIPTPVTVFVTADAVAVHSTLPLSTWRRLVIPPSQRLTGEQLMARVALVHRQEQLELNATPTSASVEQTACRS